MQSSGKHDVRDVSFHHGGITLTGKLHLPRGNGPHSAVFLLPGHGLRTNQLDAHGSFDYLMPLIGEHLVQQGIAVLQYDRPGTGGSGGDWRFQTLYDRADEALAAIDLLSGMNAIDSARIGLLGHSNGGWVAPLAASLSTQIAYIVTVAGPGISIGAQALSAFGLMLRQREVAATLQAELMSCARLILDLYQLIVQGRRTEYRELAAVAQEAIAPHKQWFEEFALALPTWEERGDILRSMDGMLDYDPAETLHRVLCPVLAIFGESDTAFDSLESASIFWQALRGGGNHAAAVEILPGADHRMYVAEEDGTRRLAPEFQPLVSTWIRQQVGSSAEDDEG